MKNSKLILGMIIFHMLWNACRKDYLQVEVKTTPVSFQVDIIPILNTNCNMVSSCHSSGGEVPDLSEANAYSQLLDLGYVDTNSPESSKLYVLMNSSSNPMPPGGKLSSDKISNILAWIEQGAQNN